MVMWNPERRVEAGSHLVVKVDSKQGREGIRHWFTCVRCGRKRKPFWVFLKFSRCKGVQPPETVTAAVNFAVA